MKETESEVFFGKSGDKLAIETAFTLEQELRTIDSSVPERTKQRRSIHRERYCIVHYLACLGSANLLTFPFTLLKSERPDFVFAAEGKTTAIEVTEVGSERHQEAQTELEKRPDGTMLVGESRLVSRGERIPWNDVEESNPRTGFAEILVSAIDKKTNSVNSDGFQSADCYELLVYDNSRFFPDLRRYREFLRNEVASWQSKNRSARFFETVSVLQDNRLLFDCARSARIIENPPWL